MPVSPRRRALALLTALGLFTGGLGVWRSLADDEPPRPASAVPPADAQRIAAALRGEPGSTDGLLEGLPPAAAQLPAGSDLELKVHEAAVDGDLARVPAVVTGPLAGRWTVLLARVDGRWRAYGAVRA